jgi:beta-lactamase class A
VYDCARWGVGTGAVGGDDPSSTQYIRERASGAPLPRCERVTPARLERRQTIGRWQPAFWVALLTFAASLLVATLIVLHAVGAQPTPAAADAVPVQSQQRDPPTALALAPDDAATPFAQLAPAAAPAGPIQEDVPSAAFSQDPKVGEAIRSVIGEDASGFGVVVKRLGDGRGASVNDDQLFYAASTFKLAILYEAERRISEGSLQLTDALQLTDEDLKEDLGTIDEVHRSADGTISIGDALQAMVTISDNSTAVALLHLLGGAQLDATMNSLGMLHTDFNTEELPTTAGDMVILMEAIYDGRGLTPEAQQHARALLLQQDTRDGIPQGVPKGVAVGNKTGNWEGATHDVAFVEAPSGTYVIAVLTSGSWVWTPIQDISATVYAALSTP